MVELGFHVTVFSRGGFPFFESEEIRQGIEPYGDHARYVYVPGGGDSFIPKEEISVALDEEVDWLEDFISTEAKELGCDPWEVYEFVDTHYWDAGVIGMCLVERWRTLLARRIITDFLHGIVSKDQLSHLLASDNRSALGRSPEYYIGKALYQDTSPIASPIDRVASAVQNWCDRYNKKRTVDARGMATRIFIEKSDRLSPSLHSILAANVIGHQVSRLCGRNFLLELSQTERHVFTPHSLGVLKEENYRNSSLSTRRKLRFTERINHEIAVSRSARAFAATSTEIAERLCTFLDVPTERIFYFPAGIDRRLYRSYSLDELRPLYRFLFERTGLTFEQCENSVLIFETSRMDRTKRKDILLSAFSKVASDYPRAICLIGGGPENSIYSELLAQIDSDPSLKKRAFLLGFLPDEMMYPLFSRADIFFTASEMEGFGLSAAQAAAVGTALISSDLVPFSLQYVPDASLIVQADDVAGFAQALDQLLRNPDERKSRGLRLFELTKSLDWLEQTRAFLEHLRQSGLAISYTKSTVPTDNNTEALRSSFIG